MTMQAPTPSQGLEALVDTRVMQHALDEARQLSSEGRLLKQGYQKLGEHSGLAPVAIQAFFETSTRHQPQVAEPGVTGAICGGLIGLALSETSPSNLGKHFLTRRLRYERELTRDNITDLFGSNAAAVLSEIRHPVSRTMCAVITAASLSYRLPQSIEPFFPAGDSFIKSPITTSQRSQRKSGNISVARR